MNLTNEQLKKARQFRAKKYSDSKSKFVKLDESEQAASGSKSKTIINVNIVNNYHTTNNNNVFLKKPFETKEYTDVPNKLKDKLGSESNPIDITPSPKKRLW